MHTPSEVILDQDDILALFAAIDTDQPNLSTVLAVMAKYYDPAVNSGAVTCLNVQDELGFTPLGRAMHRFLRARQAGHAFIMLMLASCSHKVFHRENRYPSNEIYVDQLIESYLDGILFKHSHEATAEIFLSKYAMSIAEQKQFDRMFFERYVLSALQNKNYCLLGDLRSTDIEVSDKVFELYALNSFISTKLRDTDPSSVPTDQLLSSVVAKEQIASEEILAWFVINLKLKKQQKELLIHGIPATQHFFNYLERCPVSIKLELSIFLHQSGDLPKQFKGLLHSPEAAKIQKLATDPLNPGGKLLAASVGSVGNLEQMIEILAFFYEKGLHTSAKFEEYLTYPSVSGSNGYTEICRKYYALTELEQSSDIGQKQRILLLLLTLSGARLQFGIVDDNPLDSLIKKKFQQNETKDLLMDACALLESINYIFLPGIEKLKFGKELISLKRENLNSLARILLTNLESLLISYTFTDSVRAMVTIKKSKAKFVTITEKNAYDFLIWYRLSLLLTDREKNLIDHVNMYELFYRIFEQLPSSQQQLIRKTFETHFPEQAEGSRLLRDHPFVKKFFCFAEVCRQAEMALEALLLEEESAKRKLLDSKPKKKKSKKTTKIATDEITESEAVEKENTPTSPNLADTKQNTRVLVSDDTVISASRAIEQLSLSNVELKVDVNIDKLTIDEALITSRIAQIGEIKADSVDGIKLRCQKFFELAIMIRALLSDQPEYAHPIITFVKRVGGLWPSLNEASVLNTFVHDPVTTFSNSPLYFWNIAIKAMMRGVKIRNNKSTSYKESANFYNAMIANIGINYQQLQFIQRLLTPLVTRLEGQGVKYKIYLGGGQAQQLLNNAFELPYQAVTEASDYDVSLVISLPQGLSLPSVCREDLFEKDFSDAKISSIRNFAGNTELKCDYNLSVIFEGKEVDVILYQDPDLVIRTKRPDSFKSALIGLSDCQVIAQREHLSSTLDGVRYFNDDIFTEASKLAYLLREMGRSKVLSEQLPLAEETMQRLNLVKEDSLKQVNMLYAQSVALCLTKYVRTHEQDLFQFLMDFKHLEIIFPRILFLKRDLYEALHCLNEQIKQLMHEPKNRFIFIAMMAYHHCALLNGVEPAMREEAFPVSVQKEFRQLHGRLTESATYAAGPKKWPLVSLFKGRVYQPNPLWRPTQSHFVNHIPQGAPAP